MPPHEAVIGTQVRELLPFVARHLVQQAALAVDDLVMADRQDEVLGERIHQPEAHQVVVIAAMHRIAAHVAQGVVHPPHVPLEPEPQAPSIDRGRDLGKRGALLGHGHDAGLFAICLDVHLLQERDRLVVLAPAILVGHPFASLAGIVPVQHRRHRIHAQPVDMVFVQPVDRIGGQEVLHLGSAIVVDQRVPVLVEPLARVGMFVKLGPVEAGQAMRVGREMPRHPVQQHPQPRLVRRIDQVAELMRRAEPDRRRIKAHRLIAP